jgi:hypothetical protein
MMSASGVGIGRKQDCDLASTTLESVAVKNKTLNPQSITFARIALGELYGGAQFLCPELRNPVDAAKWYFLAYAADGPSGLEKLIAAERELNLSSADISEGRKQAKSWLQRHPE